MCSGQEDSTDNLSDDGDLGDMPNEEGKKMSRSVFVVTKAHILNCGFV